jgi:DNA repair photolyase
MIIKTYYNKSMNVTIKETTARTVLSKSGIESVDYCVNPYVGCFHGCSYCYATFMKRFSGHTEQWGSFVDVKINAPGILRRQLAKAQRGTVMISSVTDAYQPVESRYKLTRQCLEVLLEYQFPVSILTKSPLVYRDIDLLKQFNDIEVGITVTTDDDRIRKLFAPQAPPISARIRTLKKLYESGVATYAFIGPVLPMDPERLAEKIRPYVDSVLIDRMNYHSKTQGIYKAQNMMRWLDSDFTFTIVERLKKSLDKENITVC